MKLSILDRILLFLSTIFMMVIGVGLILTGANVLGFKEMAEVAETTFMESSMGLLILFVCASIIVLVAIKLFLALFISSGKSSENKGDAPKNIVLKNGSDGDIMVSTDLIKDLAVRYAKTPEDVRDVDCKILSDEGGTTILMKFYLKRDIVISEFLGKMQTEIKDYVEKHCGVNIKSVDLCADVNSGNNVRFK